MWLDYRGFKKLQPTKNNYPLTVTLANLRLPT